jgi:hypothetical protein
MPRLRGKYFKIRMAAERGARPGNEVAKEPACHAGYAN